mgnify:CR=1 FL=1
MSTFKFDDNDVFINTIEGYPEYSFFINNGVVYIDQRPNISGSAHGHLGIGEQNAAGNILHALHPNQGNTGWISLYEYNINRPSGSNLYSLNENSSSHFVDNEAITLMGEKSEYQIESIRVSETDPTGSMIRPFVIKDGVRNSLKIHNNTQFNNLFDFGEVIEGDYNLSSSISRYYYATNAAPRIYHGRKTLALSEERTDEGPRPFSIKNTIEKYKFKSPHMSFITSAPLPERDLSTDEVSFLTVPSLFYGKRIKKGTVELNYYVTGSLIATLTDKKQNGELVQTFSTPSLNASYDGITAGIILYNEGLIFLTASYPIGFDNSINYHGSGQTINKWTHFGSGLHEDISSGYSDIEQASFELKYQGVTQKPSMTMLCHANYGELNWSNNPTFLSSSERNDDFTLSNKSFIQQGVTIHNSTDTQLQQYEPEFKRETYITKVAIYDDKRNLIGVATLANPVRKTEDRQYTFKLKLDL